MMMMMTAIFCDETIFKYLNFKTFILLLSFTFFICQACRTVHEQDGRITWGKPRAHNECWKLPTDPTRGLLLGPMWSNGCYDDDDDDDDLPMCHPYCRCQRKRRDETVTIHSGYLRARLIRLTYETGKEYQNFSYHADRSSSSDTLNKICHDDHLD